MLDELHGRLEPDERLAQVVTAQHVDARRGWRLGVVVLRDHPA